LSRVRVFGYVIASVDHGSTRRCQDLAAPARIRLMRVGVAELPIFLIQAVQVYGKGIRKLVVAAGGDPVLPDNSMTTKGNDERCLLLVVSNCDSEHLFSPMALRIGDCEPDSCGVNRQCLGMAEVKENVKCLGQRKFTRRPPERIVRLDPIAYLFDLCQ